MPSPLCDPFARAITYLRLSVTDRCDFRCTYCMAPDMNFLPKSDLLSLEELDRLCAAFIRLGVRKLRITGGEPLVRRDVMQLFARLGRHLETGALKELTLTTNGSQLARYAEDLYAAGVRRVNVSLDTLDPERFATITRRRALGAVLEGIDAARAAGLRVKVNTVALRGVNEDELFDLLAFCAARDLDLTFIEVMPMGDLPPQDRLARYWPLTDLRDRIEARYGLQDLRARTGGPARYARIIETGQRIGFITPLSNPFCESCNRVRVTCTGALYTCLGQAGSVDLRRPLRAREGDHALEAAIRGAVAMKPRGHDFAYGAGGVSGNMARHMSHTGG